MPTAEDFRVTPSRSDARGLNTHPKPLSRSILVNFIAQVGGYPGQNHRMPMCCAVMRSEMSAGDAILQEPPKKQGASLTILTSFPLADGDYHAKGG